MDVLDGHLQDRIRTRCFLLRRLVGIGVPSGQLGERVIVQDLAASACISKTLRFSGLAFVLGGGAGLLFTSAPDALPRFPTAFTIVAAGLAILYRRHTQHAGAAALRDVLSFVLCGLAFSSLLFLRYETSLQISRIPYYQLLAPLAVGLFTFIFCGAFLSLQHIAERAERIILGLQFGALALALWLIVDSVFSAYRDTSLMEVFLIMLPAYITIATMIVVGYLYLQGGYVLDLVLMLLAILVVGVVVPRRFGSTLAELDAAMSGRLGMVLLTCVAFGPSAFHAWRLVARRRQRQPRPHFRGRITEAFLGLELPFVFLANYVLAPAVLCILPYLDMVSHFRDTGALKAIDRRRATLLGATAFAAYLTFFGYFDQYESALFAAGGASDPASLGVVFFWAIASAVFTAPLGYCLFDIEPK